MAYAEKRNKSEYPWRVKWSIGGGKEDQASGFRTKADALAYGRDQEADLRAGRYHNRNSGDVTLDDYFWKTWLPLQRIGDKTIRNRKGAYRTHIAPRWGTKTLNELAADPFDVQAFEKELRAARAKGTADKVMEVLRFMLDDAAAAALIQRSPVLPLQRRGSREPDTSRKGVVADLGNIIAICNRLRPAEGLLILTIAFTGMRWGEAIAMRRPFLELDAAGDDRPASGRYVIDPEVGAVKENRRFGPPKNRKGRTIELPSFLAERLLVHTAAMPPGQDLLFVTPRSRGVLSHGQFNEDRWRPACDGWPAVEKRPGHPARPAAPPIHSGLTIRDLRHTHKTWLAEDDIQPVARDERLGHATRGMDGVYIHATPAMRKRILAVLQRRWERSQRSISHEPPR